MNFYLIDMRQLTISLMFRIEHLKREIFTILDDTVDNT